MDFGDTFSLEPLELPTGDLEDWFSAILTPSALELVEPVIHEYDSGPTANNSLQNLLPDLIMENNAANTTAHEDYNFIDFSPSFPFGEDDVHCLWSLALPSIVDSYFSPRSSECLPTPMPLSDRFSYRRVDTSNLNWKLGPWLSGFREDEHASPHPVASFSVHSMSSGSSVGSPCLRPWPALEFSGVSSPDSMWDEAEVAQQWTVLQGKQKCALDRNTIERERCAQLSASMNKSPSSASVSSGSDDAPNGLLFSSFRLHELQGTPDVERNGFCDWMWSPLSCAHDPIQGGSSIDPSLLMSNGTSNRAYTYAQRAAHEEDRTHRMGNSCKRKAYFDPSTIAPKTRRETRSRVAQADALERPSSIHKDMSNQGTRYWQCQCGKRYTRRTDLWRHIRKDQWPCPVIGCSRGRYQDEDTGAWVQGAGLSRVDAMQRHVQHSHPKYFAQYRPVHIAQASRELQHQIQA